MSGDHRLPCAGWSDSDNGDKEGLSLEVGNYALFIWRRECNADDGRPIYAWRVTTDAYEEGHDVAFSALISAHSKDEAKLAAEDAAASLLDAARVALGLPDLRAALVEACDVIQDSAAMGPPWELLARLCALATRGPT